MRATLVAVLATIIVFLGIPAHAQEQPQCETTSSGEEVCALVQGNNIVIMIDGDEVMTVHVEEQPKPKDEPTVVPTPDRVSRQDEPRPAVTITRIPAPATVVVPGPTSTKTVTVKPAAPTVTATPRATLSASNYDPPPGMVTTDRAIRFGLGIILLLGVLTTLGLLAARAYNRRRP